MVGFLTDHGPQHIETVISRASDLIRARSCDLSSYEVFLLLAAIHLHDVGNIHGRTGHQYTAIDVRRLAWRSRKSGCNRAEDHYAISRRTYGRRFT